MKRWSLVVFISLASVALGQDRSRLFSSDLVHWSYMQQPQQPGQEVPRQAPTPDPRPETQPAQNPTPAPDQPAQTSSQPGATTQNSTAQAFVGSIGREADSFVLKVSDSISYKLDNQQEVQQYEGKRVRVTGTLDSSANLIHVDKVEPLS